MADFRLATSRYRIANYMLFIVFVLILTYTFTRLIVTEPSQAISGTACPASYVVTLSSGTTTGTTNGVVTVGLYASPSGSTSPVIDRVIFNIDSGSILGRGIQSGTSQYFWSMLWQSSVTNNGPHTLGAEVFHTNGFSCFIPNGPITNVQNPTKTPIPIQGILPNTWSGPTNYPVDFQLISGTATSAEIRQFMQVEWSTNIGSVSAGVPNYLGRFFSGPSGGSGRVKARIFYGGEVKEIEAPVNITAFNQQTSTPPTTSNTDGSSPLAIDDSVDDFYQDSIDGSSEPDSVLPNASGSPTLTAQVLTTEGPVRNCLLSSIGTERLSAIENEESRPTAQEFEKYRTCFARQSFIVAQSLAPISPAKVRELAESKNFGIVNAETLTTEIEGKSVNTLVFRGKANPNSTILIYIFSEPLVLTTAANESGEWTYTLEDPLEPGEHEAYSLVDTGNGDYERSSVFSFAVAKAEATEANPNGFSLQLANTATATVDNRSQNIFITGAVLVIALTVGALAIIMSQYKKHKSSLHKMVAESQSNSIVEISPSVTSSSELTQQAVQTNPNESPVESVKAENSVTSENAPQDDTDEKPNSTA